MSYLIVENFRLGLDTRKFWLSSPPGSLLQIENAHITQGGEIQPRKAFVPFPTLPSGAGGQTFGLQTISGGEAVFGSADLAAQFPKVLGTQSIAYRRCQHPDGATAMNAVLCSEQFGGRAWVAAKFNDDRVFAFYEGVDGVMRIIRNFSDGVVFGVKTTTQIASEIADAIAAVTKGYSAIASGENIVLKTPPGQSCVVSKSVQSLAGVIKVTKTGDAQEPEAGSPAFDTFWIKGWPAGKVNQITAPGLGGVGTVNLLSAAVPFVKNAVNSCMDLVNAIKTTVTIPKYTTTFEQDANGGKITIFGPMTYPTAYNDGAAVIDYDAGIVMEATATTIMTVKLAGDTFIESDEKRSSRSKTVYSVNSASVTISNATGIPTCLWIPADGGSANGIVAVSPSSTITKFKTASTITPGTTISRDFVCRVVDKAAVPKIANSSKVTVTLSLPA